MLLVKRKTQLVILLLCGVTAAFFLWSILYGKSGEDNSRRTEKKLSAVNYKSELFQAAAAGDYIALGHLLGKKVDCNILDDQGHSPLMIAAAKGHVQCCALLLQEGARLEVQDALGNNALIMAAGNGHLAVAALLLRYNCQIDANSDTGKTALLAACANGHSEVVKLLLKKHAALWPGKNSGAGPVVTALRNKHNHIARILLDAGADCNEVDDKGNSALMLAVAADDEELVARMLEFGSINIYHANKAKEDVFFLAKQRASEKILQLLKKAAGIAE